MKEKFKSVFNFLFFGVGVFIIFYYSGIGKLKNDENSYKYEFIKFDENVEKSLQSSNYEENLKDNEFVVFQDVKDSSDIYFKYEPLYSEVDADEVLYCHLVDDYQNDTYLGSVVNKDFQNENFLVRLPKQTGKYQLKVYSRGKYTNLLIDEIKFRVESKFGFLDDVIRLFI